MSDITATRADLPSIPGLRLTEASLPSSLDGALQPVIVGVPEQLCAEPTPLLVGLHTWSADYRQQTEAFGPLCARYGWLMVLPNFRGPNLASNPQAQLAGGSLAAQRDIADAVAFMQREYGVDDRRVYLIGGSGGGHMSLLMAGKYPDLWAGVSSWCPITSLREWHEQQNGYAVHVEAVCGGAPSEGDVQAGSGATSVARRSYVNFEYERRSPRTFITNAANTPVRISHGDKDRCIQVAQTWRTFEELRDLPHRAEFYSWSGGHEIVNEWGCAWLAQQVKPAAPPTRLDLVSDEEKWYFWLHVAPDAPLTLVRARAEWTAPRRLEVDLERAAVTRVDLGPFGLRRLVAVECDGTAVPAADLEIAAGVLTLPPCAQPTRWRLEFG